MINILNSSGISKTEELNITMTHKKNLIKIRWRKILHWLRIREELIVKILLLSLIFTSLFILYSVIDKIIPFYEKTKFIIKFTIDGQILEFPSTTSSLFTTLVCTVLLTCIVQVIITKLYYEHNQKNLTSKKKRTVPLKKVAFVAFIYCLSEIIRNLLREINNSFKTVYTTIKAGTLVGCLFLAFGCNLISRIFSSIRADIARQVNPAFSKKQREQSLLEKDPSLGFFKKTLNQIRNTGLYESLSTPCKKVFNKKAMLAIFICSVITFGVTFLIQEWEAPKKWVLHLKKLNGNVINLLDNKNNILFTMFIEVLFLIIVLKILSQLSKQSKIRQLNNEFESTSKFKAIKNFFFDIKNATHHTFTHIFKIVCLSLLTVISANVLTAMRRTMINFTNPNDVGSWLICFAIVLTSFLVSTFCVIWNLKEMDSSESINKKNETINSKLCLICQKESHWEIFKSKDRIKSDLKVSKI